MESIRTINPRMVIKPIKTDQSPIQMLFKEKKLTKVPKHNPTP
jgi:hypothetical protein